METSFIDLTCVSSDGHTELLRVIIHLLTNRTVCHLRISRNHDECKLYRNLNWNYSRNPTMVISCALLYGHWIQWTANIHWSDIQPQLPLVSHPFKSTWHQDKCSWTLLSNESAALMHFDLSIFHQRPFTYTFIKTCRALMKYSVQHGSRSPSLWETVRRRFVWINESWGTSGYLASCLRSRHLLPAKCRQQSPFLGGGQGLPWEQRGSRAKDGVVELSVYVVLIVFDWPRREPVWYADRIVDGLWGTGSPG